MLLIAFILVAGRDGSELSISACLRQVAALFHGRTSPIEANVAIKLGDIWAEKNQL
ncbi:hypothetical protein ACFORG_09825 [Lutimaribacter marinistellae]|uniref:Uncharacterized protein n=1 Tax=Lutimaribacter marinistellae TaxID=1820329 RepID=A0ABV7TEM5_9RHOB